jgi:hypothetical protein
MKRTYLLLTFIFFNSHSFCQTVIANFDGWHNAPVFGQTTIFMTPNGWQGTDSLYGLAGSFFGGVQCNQGVFKGLPSFNGSASAVKVMTVNQPAIDTIFPAGPIPTLLTNGIINIDLQNNSFSVGGGFPISYVPNTVSMWVKNNVLPNDSTQIIVSAIDDGDNTGLLCAFADTLLWSNISNYTKITIPLKIVDSSLSPTHLQISLSSNSNTSDSAYAGTYLIVDDISITSPTGVEQYLYSSKVANVYPTIISNLLNVHLHVGDTKNYAFVMRNIEGKTVIEKNITQSINVLDVTTLAKGFYFFEIHQKNKLMQTGKLVKE